MKPPSALAIFGGTFDPVHQGHLACAQAVANLSPGLQVLLVPAGTPPHRPPPVASPEHRQAMLELALRDAQADAASLSLDLRELRQKQPSYTHDTLQSFRKERGKELPILLVLGLDSYKTLPSWRNWQALADLAHILVLPRPGQDASLPEPLAAWQAPRLAPSPQDLLSSPAGRICHQRLAEVPISATQVRAAYAEGKDASRLVPPAVDRYIRKQGLYSS